MSLERIGSTRLALSKVSDGPISFQIKPHHYYRFAMTIGRKVRCRYGFGIYDQAIYVTKGSLFVQYYCADCLPDDLS
jgi:hypothetical protein